MARQAGAGVKDMLLAARFVDQGLVELEKMLTSIEGLMPAEENKEAALQSAENLFQEVKEIEANIDNLKHFYKSLYDSAKAENEKADASIKLMEDGIDQIESALKNYGYDNSNMPESIPEEMEKNGSISENSVSSDDEVNDEVVHELATSPQREIASMSESLLGVEITPMVLSAKVRKNSHCSRSFNGVTPSSSSERNCDRVKYLSPATKTKTAVEKTKESNTSLKKSLVKPERPVLSLDY